MFILYYLALLVALHGTTHGQKQTKNKNPPTAGGSPKSSEPAVLKVACGDGACCAIVKGNTLYCWGKNDYGQLGDGTDIDRYLPTPVIGGTNVGDVATGFTHTCYVDNSQQQLWCMGTTDTGATGQTPGAPIYQAQVVLGTGTGAGNIAISKVFCNEDYTMMLTTSGHLYSMGSNTYGALGIGSFGMPMSSPTAVVSIPLPVIDVSLGNHHACAIVNNNDLYCHGFNNFAQIPNLENYNIYPSPVKINNVKAKSVACGMWHTCVIMTTGDVWCAGASNFYQAGDPNRQLRNVLTSELPGSNSINMYAGLFFSIAQQSDYTAMFWGENDGVLGDGSAASVSTPQVMAQGATYQTFAAGAYMVCGIDLSDALYCWGANNRGTLGLGSLRNSPIPSRVLFANSVTMTPNMGASTPPTTMTMPPVIPPTISQATQYPTVSGAVPTRYPNTIRNPSAAPVTSSPTPSPIPGPGDDCSEAACSPELTCSSTTSLCFSLSDCQGVCSTRTKDQCSDVVDTVPGCACVGKKKGSNGCNVDGVPKSRSNSRGRGRL